ncbi:TetR/AcrR family transcriptional regulator [Fodinicola acaciae]|uniref:TetR/AcrR family transcriptional regulator n=1 Tax=Fodinicola acaciae TaxID=2681555 RepID=UPI0013D45DCF|nr:TetR/AcrR family transcriptional regulator [Fodinicola acaciae]
MDELGPAELARGRTALKRRQITDAALALFLRNGYDKTSMDQIAADAGVSKQTVYKQFADKETLFEEIARGVTGKSDHILDELTAIAQTPVSTGDDLRKTLQRLARRYLDAVMEQPVLSLRRLIIAEADQFPELASHYYQQGPQRGLDLIESALRRWSEQGLLAAPDLRLAASQFAYLVLGSSQDHALFQSGQTPRPAERTRIAKAAASMFLAAYGR